MGGGGGTFFFFFLFFSEQDVKQRFDSVGFKNCGFLLIVFFFFFYVICTPVSRNKTKKLHKVQNHFRLTILGMV
mgnify:CR=1 FL=1